MEYDHDDVQCSYEKAIVKQKVLKWPTSLLHIQYNYWRGSWTFMQKQIWYITQARYYIKTELYNLKILGPWTCGCRHTGDNATAAAAATPWLHLTGMHRTVAATTCLYQTPQHDPPTTGAQLVSHFIGSLHSIVHKGKSHVYCMSMANKVHCHYLPGFVCHRSKNMYNVRACRMLVQQYNIFYIMIKRRLNNQIICL